MIKKYKFYFYIYKLIFLLLFLKNKKLILINNLFFILLIKILIIYIYKKFKYKLLNYFNIKNTIILYNSKNNVIKYYILNIKLHSKTTNKLKLVSYKCYILSKFLNNFGLGKEKSSTILDSIKKTKFNSLINLVNINLFKINLKNFYRIKYKKTICFINYNNKLYKNYKNYFNIILILLNINNYNIKIYNNNIDNIYKIFYKFK